MYTVLKIQFKNNEKSALELWHAHLHVSEHMPCHLAKELLMNLYKCIVLFADIEMILYLFSNCIVLHSY